MGDRSRGQASARVVADPAGNHFLRITTADAFYSVGLKRTFAAASYPELSWRWRVSKMPARTDITRKQGDDAAARLYVLFNHRSLLHPTGVRALVYVWDDSHRTGSMIPNPYAPRDEKAIVMESGGAHLSQWISEQADLAGDYERAFGEPAGAVRAIVCASDSDNTHSSSEADFDDITVSSRHSERR